MGKIKFNKMKSNILKPVTFFFAIIALVSCNKPVSDKTYSDVKSLTDDIKKNICFISQKDFHAILNTEAQFNLLDCREKLEYDSACIPGAVNVPRGKVEFDVGNKIQERRIPLYVYSDNEEKSILTAKALKMIKFSSVIVIQGNWKQWATQFPDAIQLEPNAGKVQETAAPVEEEGGCGG